ncbi:Nse4 C-terminal-domain-containing protein [Scheffersomyces coipomensis]|uniref:Nse4 C-terminal-domain-containing protein n=1 Tax=Scheffersomyces coipomensis TaxID=1788519 RepID=UPI00315D6668
MTTNYQGEDSDSGSGESSDGYESQRPRKAPKLDKQQYIQDYEKFMSELANSRAKAKKGEASELTISHLKELENLFQNIQSKNVRDTKIQLKDSEAFKETADFAAFNARNLKFEEVGVSVAENEFSSLIRKFAAKKTTGFKSEFSEEYVRNDSESEEEVEDEDDDYDMITGEEKFNSFNWLKLGALYYQISRRSIKNDFLNGPLATERRRAAPRTRNVDDTKSGISTTAKTVLASDIANNEEKNTAYMIRTIYETIMSKDVDDGLNFFKLFINPHSFSQSVENLFFTSFLIKDARLKLYTDEHGIPMVKRVLPGEREYNAAGPKEQNSRHNIATLNYNTWQNLIERFNITEAFLGNRDEEEDFLPEDHID